MSPLIAALPELVTDRVGNGGCGVAALTATTSAWDAIDRRLDAEFLPRAGQSDADGYLEPVVEVVHLAREAVAELRDAGTAAPSRVVPNGEGGLVLEWSCGERFHTLEFDADRQIEFVSLDRQRVAFRQRLR